MTVWPNGTQTMPTLTSPYGDPRPGSPTGIHNGADFIGFPSVRAVEAGVVKYAGWNDLMGNIVYASHANDAYRTRSCHMAYPPTVTTGQSFHQGDMFGVPGNTGSESRGTHLHFDVYLLGTNGWYRTDPVAFLNKRMGTTAGGGATPFPESETKDDDMPQIITGDGYHPLLLKGDKYYPLNSGEKLEAALRIATRRVDTKANKRQFQLIRNMYTPGDIDVEVVLSDEQLKAITDAARAGGADAVKGLDFVVTTSVTAT